MAKPALNGFSFADKRDKRDKRDLGGGGGGGGGGGAVHERRGGIILGANTCHGRCHNKLRQVLARNMGGMGRDGGVSNTTSTRPGAPLTQRAADLSGHLRIPRCRVGAESHDQRWMRSDASAHAHPCRVGDSDGAGGGGVTNRVCVVCGPKPEGVVIRQCTTRAVLWWPTPDPPIPSGAYLITVDLLRSLQGRGQDRSPRANQVLGKGPSVLGLDHHRGTRHGSCTPHGDRGVQQRAAHPPGLSCHKRGRIPVSHAVATVLC